MARSLLFVTGTRADFGKLEPLAAASRDAGFEVGFYVTGIHMLELYGLTKLEVARMPGVAIHEFANQDVGDPLDAVMARTVKDFSGFVRAKTPDLVVVHGDRAEALACALVCATNYVRCAHVEGGEVSGTIDEIFRHCNTKLAHAHFVSSEEAKGRVMALGEPEPSVHVIGSPELDIHAGPSTVGLDEVRSRYEIGFDEYGICVLHPVTSEADTFGDQCRPFFSALEDSGRSFVVIMPNNDPGSEAIFECIGALPRERFRCLPSMRFAHFSELMRNAKAFVGNSSAGVREAPFLGVPSLDVGTRQNRRSSAPSIVRCKADDTKAVLGFLRDRWGTACEPHAQFGEGNAAGRFVAAISDVGFWERGLQKEFCDLP